MLHSKCREHCEVLGITRLLCRHVWLLALHVRAVAKYRNTKYGCISVGSNLECVTDSKCASLGAPCDRTARCQYDQNGIASCSTAQTALADLPAADCGPNGMFSLFSLAAVGTYCALQVYEGTACCLTQRHQAKVTDDFSAPMPGDWARLV